MVGGELCVSVYIRTESERNSTKKLKRVFMHMPIPAAVRSITSVCGLSLAEIVGSNPAGGRDVCLL